MSNPSFRMPALLALSLGLAALAGCTGDPGSPSDAPPASSGAGAPAAPALLAASADPAPDAAAPANATSPFRMEGETPVGACAIALLVAQCHLQGGRDAFRELEAPGLPLRVSGTLWYNATVPGDAAPLQLIVMHDEGDGWTFGPGDPYVSGPSPLEFDLPLLTVRGKVALSVTQAAGAPLAVGYAAAMLPQTFALDGALHYQVAAA